MVRIDHTVVDVMVVDDHERRPIGRPYLTIAIDVFSRAVLGFAAGLALDQAHGTAFDDVDGGEEDQRPFLRHGLLWHDGQP